MFHKKSISYYVKCSASCFLVILCQYGFSQAPVITFQTPQSYPINKAIKPLTPQNSGGTVPVSVFGIVTTVAGSGNYGSDNGSAATASFNVLAAAVPDAFGNLFVADYLNSLIREVSASGLVSTYAGGPNTGNFGVVDGPAAQATFFEPTDVAVDAAGNVFVCDWTHSLIRKITPGQIVSTVAGNNAGFADGIGQSAEFLGPIGIIADASDNLFVCDYGNHAIRKVTQSGVVTTVAGNGIGGYTDGIGRAAQFNRPYGITIDKAGNLYVADRLNQRIRKITPTGLVTTVAGNGTQGSANGTGAGATFNKPWGITIDPAGNLYTSSDDDNLIRKITPAGVVTTFAGSGAFGDQDGVGSAAIFGGCEMMSSDNNGNLYVANSGTNQIRKIVTSGYAIDKVLPAGLTFDNTTGIISGTPTALSAPTNYTVTAYNGTGHSDAIINIAVSELPVITFPALQAATICTADFAPLATGNIGTISYTSSNTAVAAIVGGKVHITGPGTAVITAIDGNASATQSLTVTAPLIPAVSITGYTGACAGMPVTFSVTVANGGAHPGYQWQVNGVNQGTSSAQFSSVVVPSDVISCTVTNTDVCPVSGTSNKVTGVQPVPLSTPAVTIQASFAGPVCSGTNVSFTASPGTGGLQPNYQWQVNGANSGDDSPQFSSANLSDGDKITCILTIAGGVCVTSSVAVSNAITVKVDTPALPAPSLTISASGNGGYPGQGISFTAIAQNAGTIPAYQWSVNGNDAGTSSKVFSSTVLNNGDAVTCSIAGENSCNPVITSNVITVIILPSPLINVPNAFSPNGDGINDLWDIPSLAGYPACTVDIYTRYGTRVFHSVGYSKPWNGTMGGTVLPAGTYYYLIDLKTKNKPLSNWVSLLR